MSKTKILIVQLIGCIILGTMIGLGWWLCDGGKVSKKVSECNSQEMALKIREIRDCLESYQKGHISMSSQGLMELKDELRRLMKDKPAKIYAGKWHKDYLEVIGK